MHISKICGPKSTIANKITLDLWNDACNGSRNTIQAAPHVLQGFVLPFPDLKY